LSPQKLADWLAEQTRAGLAEMAARAREWAKPEATEHVARVCSELASGLSETTTSVT
jgi:UDP-N-acetylglucosamine--N-acetylmuramyl-(pentapeptide) pyrophosphoryl-undecaprenol N-acetylglucosamine transferase